MKIKLSAVLFVCCVAAAALAQKVDRRVDVAAELQSVVRAERAFARMASEQGTRAAFLANMTDDAVVMNAGQPANAKKVWTERPNRPGLLSWEPVYADVARAGDLGYTTGPWEFRPGGASDKPVAFGEFFTIWRKQPNGAWKWELDIGISHPARVSAPPSLTFPKDFRQNTDRDKLDVNVERTKTELLKTERAYSAASAKGTSAAFDAYAVDDVRLLREGQPPILGRAAARRMHTASPGTLITEPAFSSASRSGELGYAYGTYEFKPAGGKPSERGHYVRVWKKGPDGKWRIVLDLQNPAPPPAPPAG